MASYNNGTVEIILDERSVDVVQAIGMLAILLCILVVLETCPCAQGTCFLIVSVAVFYVMYLELLQHL